MIWLVLLPILLLSSAAWADNPPAQTPDQQTNLDALQALTKECEGTIHGLQGKADGLRRSPSAVVGDSLSDLKQARDDYQKRCGELGKSLENLRRESRSTSHRPSRDLVDLEHRLLGLGRAERKLDGSLKMIEVEEQRKAETARRKTETEQRRAENEQRRKENAERRATETTVRRLQQQAPTVIEKGKEILDDRER